MPFFLISFSVLRFPWQNEKTGGSLPASGFSDLWALFYCQFNFTFATFATHIHFPCTFHRYEFSAFAKYRAVTVFVAQHLSDFPLLWKIELKKKKKLFLAGISAPRGRAWRDK